MNKYLYFFFVWIFIQYQLAIFLIGAIRPRSSSGNRCPICALHFSDRFHHCFFVNRCIAKCNVHCFLSFTFYATISTLICFVLFFNQFFLRSSVSSMCLLPLGEFLCRNLTWTQSGLVMLTRSTLMAAGCAGGMGVFVAKEFYYDQTDRSRTLVNEMMKIFIPTLSLLRSSD